MRHILSLLPRGHSFRSVASTTSRSRQLLISSIACTRVYPKVSGLSHKEIYAYNNRNSLRSNAKDHGGKIHYTDSQNSDTTAPNGRELYHLQFSLQAASPENFGYTLLYKMNIVWSKSRDSSVGIATRLRAGWSGF
jgi:hypothetical protein